MTRQGNSRNMRLFSTNKTGITGVYWYKKGLKWQVRIRVDGYLHHLGYYHDFFEACCARKSAEIKYGFHKNHGSNRPL